MDTITDTDTDFLFIIYSCKKNTRVSNEIYEKINNKLTRTKAYILYGDQEYFKNKLHAYTLNAHTLNAHTLNAHTLYAVIDDKYIILNTEDTYDTLNNKTLLLLQTAYKLYPSIKGLFKCDDDIIVNINHINNLINDLILNKIQENDYIGKRVNVDNNNLHHMKMKGKENNVTLGIKYCGGPLYYVSNKAIKLFTTTTCDSIYYEDVMVGNHLGKSNIYPNPTMDLYSDFNVNCNTISYHNKIHSNQLHIMLNGNLGNILFQIACAAKFANSYNKNFVLNENGITGDNKQEIIHTIKGLFPDLQLSQELLNKEHYFIYNQPTNSSYVYTKSEIDYSIQTYNNVILSGHFINYNYIPDVLTTTIFNNIIIAPTNTPLLNHNFTNTYFIHIVLEGDLNNALINLNIIPYYQYCINRIISINPNAIFYICSNKTINYIKLLLKNIVINNKMYYQPILHNNYSINNEINTLYIMSMCCGGICSNSALSMMGAHFQLNKRKDHLYMPYPFVNGNISPSSEENLLMYPEWCSVYDIDKNRIIK